MKKEQKIFVLDTNVCIHDPDCLDNFAEHDIVIPITVLDELDELKTKLYGAREFLRHLDHILRPEHINGGGYLGKGRGRLKIMSAEKKADIPPGLSTKSRDNNILGISLALKNGKWNSKERKNVDWQYWQNKRVIIVSKDTNLRVKAIASGLSAEDYTTDKVSVLNFYRGYREMEIEPEYIESFKQNDMLDIGGGLSRSEVHPHEIIILKHESQSVFSKVDDRVKQLIPLKFNEKNRAETYGLRPRNLEQLLAINLLRDHSIPLVTITGKAGTGKTLLALAAALDEVMEQKRHTRVLVSRPIVPMGRDVGYLPGALDEKLDIWMGPIYDNLDFLHKNDARHLSIPKSKRGDLDKDGIQMDSRWRYLIDRGVIELGSLTHIRGRSLSNHMVIIDEAQNMSPHEAKTIITRCGEGTRIILVGDTDQIDHPFLDRESNGLSYVVQRFARSAMSAHIHLIKGERSPLAEEAASLL